MDKFLDWAKDRVGKRKLLTITLINKINEFKQRREYRREIKKIIFLLVNVRGKYY